MPAHGAGSSCGKNLSTELTSTIGEQRRTNPSVQPMSEDAFVELITHGQPAAPSYFSVDAAMNKRIHPLLDQIPQDSRAEPGADPHSARRRRARGRCPQRRRLRGRTSARLGQRRLRRPLRRNRRHGRRHRGQDRTDHVSRRGAGRRAAAGPRRFGQRHRIPHRRPRRRLSRRSCPTSCRPHRASPSPSWIACSPRMPSILIDIRNPGEVEQGASPARSTSRWRSCEPGSTWCRPIGRSSCTAPAAGAPAWPPRCCGPTDLSTCRIWPAATTPGPRPTPQSNH